MKVLYVIPARGGSKGIPHKNIKLLAGKPLIYYSIDVARALTSDENICVSTDDDEIIEVVEKYGLKVPFVRPEKYATDTATTNDVLIHAIDFYKSRGKKYDVIVLLQPTSPLRKVEQVKEALSLYHINDLDMVVSVKESHAATVLCNENNEGYLELTINPSGIRRQDIANFYEYNGAIYIINVSKLMELSLSGLIRKKKYVMNENSSIDIDNEFDWLLAETLMSDINKK
jgi:N-acylneuraminate cytidylyltransferase